MSKKDKEPLSQEEQVVEEASQTEAPETPIEEAATDEAQTELDAYRAKVAEQEDKFLRLCAEYDNFRKRTHKEKEGIYADATANAVSALLPVYD
ncbi:MAG: nucleotide exchange factor GrpE, partial [Oscillospiraceae bacterium]|nr:nucleotide exchange factor GrpE [Oscillospiraceae bacterium]